MALRVDKVQLKLDGMVRDNEVVYLRFCFRYVLFIEFDFFGDDLLLLRMNRKSRNPSHRMEQ